MEALFRVRRHGAPPHPPRPATPPAGSVPPAGSRLPNRKRTLPKTRHAKYKPGTYANRLKNRFAKRERHKTRFWRDQVISIENVPRDQLARAVCHTHQATVDFEFREAFDHAMQTMSPEERRIASMAAEHGITHTARESGVSWRQIANALVSMRAVFEKAGFDRMPARSR